VKTSLGVTTDLSIELLAVTEAQMTFFTVEGIESAIA